MPIKASIVFAMWALGIQTSCHAQKLDVFALNPFFLFLWFFRQTAQFNVEHFSGMHNWYACSHARPTFCNVCKDSLSGVTSHGLSCEGKPRTLAPHASLRRQTHSGRTKVGGSQNSRNVLKLFSPYVGQPIFMRITCMLSHSNLGNGCPASMGNMHTRSMCTSRVSRGCLCHSVLVVLYARTL